MSEVVDRKREEVELHDSLRGEHRDDLTYKANEKFYAVTRSSVDFVHEWLLAHCRGRKVLDYCCGDGPNSLWLAEAGAEVHGIDISRSRSRTPQGRPRVAGSPAARRSASWTPKP